MRNTHIAPNKSVAKATQRLFVYLNASSPILYNL